MQGICPHCKEPVEVGEANEPVQMGERTRYFHVGHFRLWQEATLQHYQEQLQTVTAAGMVH